MSDYFSDRENGPRARTHQVILPVVWAGLVGTVQSLIKSGALGLRFPERYPDGQAVCGSDSDALSHPSSRRCLAGLGRWKHPAWKGQSFSRSVSRLRPTPCWCWILWNSCMPPWHNQSQASTTIISTTII